ncbi:hypothetical protein Q5P01_001044 [Channa striata]|uniref:Ig-like domain-containing protein n=1 Tax=Channa striata TaxID=64152 RepID=A0AA88T2G2_CHASR|nr:hypothetical protein Q5P01_001044 [Channa striata]
MAGRVHPPRVKRLKDRRKENIQGAAPEPYIKLLKQTKDWALLECLVRGASPTPKLQWQDSSGTIIHSEEPRVSGREVSLQTTVNKSNVYRCVATQDEFKHRIDAEIHVYLGDNQTGWIVAGVLGGLLILAIILLGIKHCHNKL